MEDVVSIMAVGLLCNNSCPDAPEGVVIVGCETVTCGFIPAFRGLSGITAPV